MPWVPALAWGKLFPMYDDLISWPNLLLAYQNAAKGKRGLPNVAAFEHRLEENLLSIQEALQTFTYRPGPYVSFFIHEPKKRLISAAPFADRVVHHALCNLIEPLFERSFIADSYANRRGKGTHRALDRCQQLARQYPYVLQIDLRQFFPSVDHAILRRILQRKITSASTIWLVEHILASGAGILAEQYEMAWFPGDDLLAPLRPRGLPIGNLTSQFWANCYLNPFDHFVKRELRCAGYVRYVDDALVFAHDKRTLWQWRAAVEDRLAQLRLTIHPGAQPRPVTEGVPFLGFVVYPGHRLVKGRKVVYARRQLTAGLAAYRAGGKTTGQLSASIRGWINHVRYANSWHLRQQMLRNLVL